MVLVKEAVLETIAVEGAVLLEDVVMMDGVTMGEEIVACTLLRAVQGQDLD